MSDPSLWNFARKYPDPFQRSMALLAEGFRGVETMAFGAGALIDFVVVAPNENGTYYVEVHYVGEDEWEDEDDAMENFS
jgi:hypothetical protein